MRGVNDPFFPDGLPGPAASTGGGADPARALPSPHPRPPAASAFPDLPALIRALRGRWLLVLVVGAIAAAASGAMAWKLVPRPKFTASALVEVKAEKPNLLSGEATGRNADLRIFQSTQLSLLRSRLVLNAALGKPGVADLPTVRAQAAPVEWLGDELVAEFHAGSELMKVSLSGDRPTDLAALVNAVTDAYLDEVVSKDHNDRKATASQLDELLKQYNDKLAVQRGQLREMAESVGSDDKQTLALKQQYAVQQLAGEKKELLQVQSELKRSRAELTVLKDSGAAQGPPPHDERAVQAALDREPELQAVRAQITKYQDRLEHHRRLVRTESDPSVRESRRTIERLRRDETDLRSELRPRVVAELDARQRDDGGQRLAEIETRVKILNEYEKLLTQGVDRLEGESQNFNRTTIDLGGLKDEVTQGEEMARELRRRVEALNVELKAPQRGRLIERADSPRMESPRKRLMAVGLAMIGAFGAVVVGASWRELRLRRVDSADEVTESLGLRLVGTLPALPGPGRGRGKGNPPSGQRGGAGGGWEHLLVESIDAARTVLLRDCHSGDLRTILVTSAAKGEGKSSLSGHLAISLSRTGRRTLLIDMDLRSPTVHTLFELPVGPGVCELLRGEASLDETTHAVAEDLDVVTAGACDPRAVRALGQPVLPELLASLAARYDLVVIDSAPLLPVADSLLTSQHVDAVLLSVYREVSRLPAVYAGYARLTALGVRVLGAVVTGVPVEQFGPAYQYNGARR